MIMRDILVINLAEIGVVKWANAVVGLLVWLCIYHFWWHRSSPGPKAWPIIGSTLELVANVSQFHDWLLMYSEQYDTFKVPTFGRSFIYTVDPVNLEHIFRNNWKNYGKGKAIPSTLSDLYGSGVFTADGEQWEWHRKILQRHLFSSAYRKYNLEIYKEAGIRVSSILIQLASKGTKELEMQDIFRRMAFDSIFQNVCGVKLGSLSSSFPTICFMEAFENAETLSMQRAVDPFWKLKRLLILGSEAILKDNLLILDRFIYKIIKKRRSELVTDQNENRQEGNGDLLSRILITSVDDPKVDKDNNIRDVILNAIEAGRSTIANALSWTFFMIYSHPRVEAKILEEISNVMGQKTKEDKFDHLMTNIETYANLLHHEALSRMHYIHATLTESLRLYPSVPVNAREALSDDKLPDGTRVKKGDFVSLIPYSMGRMKSIWGPDAAEFKPERWLKDGVFQPASACRFSVFSVGPRKCLGKDAAYVQMKVIISILLRFFNFKLVAGQKVRYRMAPTLPMSKNGLLLTFDLRRNWQNYLGSDELCN